MKRLKLIDEAHFEWSTSSSGIDSQTSWIICFSRHKSPTKSWKWFNHLFMSQTCWMDGTLHNLLLRISAVSHSKKNLMSDRSPRRWWTIIHSSWIHNKVEILKWTHFDSIPNNNPNILDTTAISMARWDKTAAEQLLRCIRLR